MTAHNRSLPAAAPADPIAAAREQLRLELLGDIRAGRGKLPRDKSGRVSAGFLEQSRGRAPAGLEAIGSILAGAIAAAPAPAAEQLGPRSQLERLELLERDLARLLEHAAPRLWLELRAPLRRLLNRARRQLRADARHHSP